MRRALITGSAGFLGRNLARALSSTGIEVDGLDLVAHDAVGSGRSFVGNVGTALTHLPRYDAVFHLAATVGGRRAIEERSLEVAGNMALDLAFFDYVARSKPERAAYVSSAAVYSVAAGEEVRWCEADADPTGEGLASPDGVYGWVKLTGERVAKAIDRPVLCYRPFSVYGPDQADTYPVPAIVRRAIAGEDPLRVWGSGHQVRDFLHVDDAVDAMVATYRRASGPLNLCTGIGTTFATVAHLAAAASGRDRMVEGNPAEPAGVARRVGDPSRMQEWYSPRVTIAAGIAGMVDSLVGMNLTD